MKKTIPTTKTIENLLNEIKWEFKCTENSLMPYTYLDEVNSFVERLRKNFKAFEKAVEGYNKNTSVLVVRRQLAEEHPSKKYLVSICIRGGEYFKTTGKIRKAIETDLAYREMARFEKKEGENNPDYAIPDELSPKEFLDYYVEEAIG